jgi:hypothetical protein
MQSKNEITRNGNYCVMSLYNRDKQKVAETIFSARHYQKVKDIRWYLSTSNGYVATGAKYNRICFHRFILGPNGDKIIDHINQNKLDNRDENLRHADRSLNSFNSKIRVDNISGFRGVSFHKQHQKWRADIVKNRRQIHLGLTSSFDEACRLRREAELQI